jgi:Flp pilus assembly protein TadB
VVVFTVQAEKYKFYEEVKKLIVVVIGSVLLGTCILSIILFHLTKTKDKKTTQHKVYKRKRIKKLMEHSYIKRIDAYLKSANYPFGLGIEQYIFYHLIGVFFIAFFGLYRKGINGMIVIGASLMVLNLMIYTRKKRIDERFLLELCNVQDIIYFQSKIGTSDDVIYAHAAKMAKPPLKGPFRNFAEKYRLNKDLKKSLEELRSANNSMEFQAFTFIIEQRQKTGFASENHQAQATMLKRSKRLKRRMMRGYKRTKLIGAAIMLFVCYIALVMIPLGKEILRTIDLLFR